MTIHGGIRGFVIASVLSLVGVGAVYAHTHLDRASPAAGSMVASAPGEVVLHFTEKLEPKFSAIVVRDAGGLRVDKGDSSVDKTDQALLRVSLQSLAPGRYKVEWRVISVDTHSSKGDYTFRVGK